MISLADLKARLNLKDTEHDVLLPILERAAVADFERETQRYFGIAQTVYEVLSGSGTPYLWLANDPLPGAAITVTYRDPSALDWLTFPAGTYAAQGRRLTLFQGVLNAAGGLPSGLNSGAIAGLAGDLGGGWPVGFDNIRVDYTRGYLMPVSGTATDTQLNVPADVRDAVIEMVNQSFRSRLTATSDVNPLVGSTRDSTKANKVSINRVVSGAVAEWRIPALAGGNGQMRQTVVVANLPAPVITE